MANSIVLYLKGETNTEVQSRDVMLKDILTIECADSVVANKVKVMKILKIPEDGPHRQVISILKVISCIHKEYPNLQIENLGSADLIVTYEGQEQAKKRFEYVKVAVICLVVFAGAAFSIMSFNNDISITKMFGQIYKLVMGEESSGFTVLEISYSIGISVGILVFFNHFGKKRFSVDPTPMEVEMRLYENDIESTLVDIYSRKGEEQDVD